MAESYGALKKIAASLFRKERRGHTLQPTALVHEAFIRLASRAPDKWTDERHFFAVASIAMRQVLVEHARMHATAKRGGGWRRISLSDESGDTPAEVADILALDEALTELAARDKQAARLIELRFFGGLTAREAAGVLGISTSKADADWRFGRSWLSKAMDAGHEVLG